MRTTLYIEDNLLAAAKNQAQKQGRTLTALVQDALREVLARRKSINKKRITLPTSKGGEVMPGIDLDNSASLWQLDDLDHIEKWSRGK